MSRPFVPPSEIRCQFAEAMSSMYRQEVPQYGELVELVQKVNQNVLDQNPVLHQELAANQALHRLSAERHGAIRLGKASELFTMRRLFAVMAMHPVAYYDLTEAGIPVHSTAFRPLTLDELNANPFRIFTSLLRLDLIDDLELRHQAETLLEKRQIFTPGVLQLIDQYEQQQGLNDEQTQRFVSEALHTFRWHQQATVDKPTYQRFVNTHRLVADIVCFHGPHINHLTPRTLDIDTVQQQMPEHGMQPKAIIEGPPKRNHPILLRQTSFKALQEPVDFMRADGSQETGEHTARFGEIEQRGMALTPKGRQLYDQLLLETRQQVDNPVNQVDAYYRQLENNFQRFPDDLQHLRRQGLGYFRYRPGENSNHINSESLDDLIAQDVLRVSPITYEDFLPVSAAGIFQSNLDEKESQDFIRSPNQQAFERDLGCPVINEFSFYAKIQYDSLLQCLQSLKFTPDRQDFLLAQLQTGD